MNGLDNIDISERIYSTWLSYCQYEVGRLLKRYPGIQADEIPDENFRIKEDGSGEIFVKIRDVEIKMGVPRDEFIIKRNF